MSLIELSDPAELDELETIPVLPEEPATREHVLLKAADLIEQKGWISGHLGNARFGYCVMGAVAAAANESNMHILERRYGLDYNVVSNFNDHFHGIARRKSLLSRGRGYHVDKAKRDVVQLLRNLAEGRDWDAEIVRLQEAQK